MSLSTTFAVAIDSDGCVFDNMSLKHRECFGPSLIRLWQLEAVAGEVQQAWETINLYSPKRGINRFLALLAFWRSFPSDQLPQGFVRPDISGMEVLADGTASLSPDSIKRELAKKEDRFLSQALEWSRAVNRCVAELKSQPPSFPCTLEFIRSLSAVARIDVVSSANRETIQEEWTAAGLDPFVNDYVTQERCSKKEYLTDLVRQGRNTLMIGDSPGDWDAAKAAGSWFYPILPGNEAESWRKLLQFWEESGHQGVFCEHSKAVDEYSTTLGL
ncbi:HAD family hydrolase [Puniceicoccus vermicola]|uniref:HAD hydrolase-like protein n=1 Tax=Puniceicoccus vermicola TaxID=388746 RepID=A0A7X1E4Z4_9BACT|nr:HAD hydrolase-like protein [Puniceicoccus vermicola]MBC2602584.1 HAD hydrolase-like protein [Puniceicoccus vermicola]